MHPITEGILMQLLAQSPMLVVLIGGAVVAAIFWRRGPLSSALTLIASVGLLLIALTRTVVSQYLLLSYREWGWDTQRLSNVMAVQGMAGTILQAIFLALLLWAVFAGRSGVRGDTRTPDAAS